MQKIFPPFMWSFVKWGLSQIQQNLPEVISQPPLANLKPPNRPFHGYSTFDLVQLAKSVNTVNTNALKLVKMPSLNVICWKLTTIYSSSAKSPYFTYVCMVRVKFVPPPLTLSLPECLMEFCKVTLTFESVDNILWCDHSNESSLPVLTHGAICLSKFYEMKFGNLVEICLWLHLAVKGLKHL